MAGVTPEQARRFYEEDEDPAKVFAEFDAAEKGVTTPPGERAPADWSARLRDALAAGLRALARAVESSRTPGR